MTNNYDKICVYFIIIILLYSLEFKNKTSAKIIKNEKI